jgi:hypothetical protein
VISLFILALLWKRFLLSDYISKIPAAVGISDFYESNQP